MIRNYLKIAWRNLTRNKTYAVINIGGLALALAVFIIILLFVKHELSYNESFAGSNKIYRALIVDKGPFAQIMTSLPEPIAGELEREYPEVDQAVRVTGPYNGVLLKGKNEIYADGWAQVGKDFFDIFKYQFIAGNPSTAVSKPNSVVITKELAQKLYGRTDVMGKTITLGSSTIFTITGIIQNPPGNTTLHMKAFAYMPPATHNSWNYYSGSVYIELHNADQITSLRHKISDFVQNNYKGPPGSIGGKYLHLVLEPVTAIHLYPKGKQANSSRLFYIKILLIVAALILLVACINYMNMATARSAERAREIGIRKTVGAFRRQIISQVMVESAITCSSAFIISLALVELFRPLAMHYFDISLGTLASFSWWFGILIGLVVLVSLLSGGYAALYLSSFHPVEVLKGKGSRRGKMAAMLRKVLVVVQFGISIAIIIATLLIGKQMEFVRTNRLNVMVIL